MLQIANGGYSVVQIDGEEVDFLKSAPSYFEPGFNIMFSLEFTYVEAETIYLLLRKRDDKTGKTFAEINPSEFEVKVTDTTTGKSLDYAFTTNSVSSEWDRGDFLPLVLAIDAPSTDENDQLQKIRNITVMIKDITTKEFILFKAILDTAVRPFAYLAVNHRDTQSREKTASFGTSALLDLPDGGLYVILSPYSTFEESTKEDSDFAYPLNQIFYELESTANSENYIWTINSTSHDEMKDSVKVYPLPGFPKIGILFLDGRLREDVIGLTGQTYVEVAATGVSSGNSDIFRMYLAKSNGICVL